MESGNNVKLPGTDPSPMTNPVQIALKLKSIEYEFIEVDVFNKSELLLKSNPVYKRIPVLIHGENRCICESLLIIEYINEVWPNNGPSFLPPDPFDRAVARFWAAYVDDQWLPLMLQLRDYATGEEGPKKELKDKIIEKMLILERAFINCSKGKAFFSGDDIGYLDIALGSHLGWLRGMETLENVKLLDETKMPNLVEWAHKFSSNEVVKDVTLEPRKLLEILEMVRSTAKKVNLSPQSRPNELTTFLVAEYKYR